MKYLLLLVLLQFVALIELVYQNAQLRIELQNLQEEINKTPQAVSFREINGLIKRAVLGQMIVDSVSKNVKKD